MGKVLKKWQCTLPDYPVEVKVSERRRVQYWKKGENIPKKYQKDDYVYDKDGYLIDVVSKEKVVRNNKTAGKPRLLTINAQKIYVGIHHSVRSKIVNELHELFNDAFKKQLPKQILLNNAKIMITLHFYDVYSSKLPDLDNLANLFVKCGIDCLTTVNNPNQVKEASTTHKLGILPDDKMIFIPHIAYEFTHVKDIKDRKLHFNLYLVEDDFSLEKMLDNNLPNETGE